MSQAVVDPNELRRFAQNLRRFNGELTKQLGVLQAQFAGLAATWRDQEHKKFVEAFEHQILAISSCVESTNDYIPFLIRKADRIDHYLQQR